MTTATAHVPAPAFAQTAPNLRPMRFEDYAAIARLEESNGLRSLPERDWRSLWLDNPLWNRVGKTWPLGWVLEDASGALVGSFVNLPFLHTLQGREIIVATGRGWVVQPEFRGVALWLMDEYFNQDTAELFLNNTVNVLSADLNNAMSTRIPLGDWQAATFFVTNYRGFARTALLIKNIPAASALAFPAGAALWSKDRLAARTPQPIDQTIGVAEVAHFDSGFDSFYEQLIRHNPGKLLAARDSRTLNWHFAIPMRAGRIWILAACRNGLMRAYCVLRREDQSEGREGLRRMRLVDFQTLEPENDLLPSLLGVALKRCVAENIHVLEHVGADMPKFRAFDQSAPYRRTLPNWKFYYKTADPSLHAALQDPAAWDPSTYDGDATIALD